MLALVRLEQLAQVRDVHLQRRQGVVAGVVTPDAENQSVGRDHPAQVEQQQRQDSALLRPPQGHGLLAFEDLERTEHAVLHHANTIGRRTDPHVLWRV